MTKILEALGITMPQLNSASYAVVALVSLMVLLKVIKELSDLIPSSEVTSTSYATLRKFTRKMVRILDKSFSTPVFPVVAFGLMANMVGYTVRAVLPGSLFLDMIGTAAVALSCGPLWAIVVACLTNFTMFIIDQGPSQPFFLAFGHTNVTGAAAWGILASLFRFQYAGFSQEFTKNAMKVFLIAICALPIITIAQFAIQVYEAPFEPRIPSHLSTYKPDPAGTSLPPMGFSEALRGIFLVAVSILPDKLLAILLGWLFVWSLFPMSRQHVQFSQLTFQPLNMIVPGILAMSAMVFMALSPTLLFKLKYEVYNLNVMIPMWATIGFSVAFWIIYIALRPISNKLPSKAIVVSECGDWAGYHRFRERRRIAHQLKQVETTYLVAVLVCLTVLLILYLPWNRNISLGVEAFIYLFQCACMYLGYMVLQEAISQNAYLATSFEGKSDNRDP